MEQCSSAFQVYSAVRKITDSPNSSIVINKKVKKLKRLKRLENKNDKQSKKEAKHELKKQKALLFLKHNNVKPSVSKKKNKLNRKKSKNEKIELLNLSNYVSAAQANSTAYSQASPLQVNSKDKRNLNSEREVKRQKNVKHSARDFDKSIEMAVKIPSNAPAKVTKLPKLDKKKIVAPKKELKKSDDIMQDITWEYIKDDDELDDEDDGIFDHPDPFIDTKNALQWLLHPMDVDEFFSHFWEKKPYVIRRPESHYDKTHLASTPMIDEILRTNHIMFTKNLDITTYYNGVRETHNPEGRAYPSVVWDYYLNDCSVRMLNPQSYIPSLHKLNSILQEYFNCFVGANLYLTPPNSQGFAPHFDDIEAFILQIEGKKRWRLYKPSKKDCLPRYSSKNFTDDEIGEPIMDIILEQGDLLYFPRGTIHQGETVDNTHSLHITLSVYQKNSWGDFMEKVVPQALKTAIEENVKFRAGMPVGYLKQVGSAYGNKQSEMKNMIISMTKSLMEKMTKYIDVDQAADEMAKGHIHDYLPPVMTWEERQCSVLEDGERMLENGETTGMSEIEPDTQIRLLRQHCVRLVKEGGENRLYYSTENSKVYHEYELQYLEISKEFLPAMKKIITQYPMFIRVEDLPIKNLDDKIQLVKDLWEKSIVVTSAPLPSDCM